MSEPILRFVHISDTHLTPADNTEMRMDHYSPRVLALIKQAREQNPDTLSHEHPRVAASVASRRMIEEINRLPFAFDFVLHTGDIMTDGTVDEYGVARDMFSQINAPVFYIPGNHDSAEGIQRLLVGASEIKPTYDYEFEAGGVQVVCVDSATNGSDHGGKLSDEQLAWLDALCSVEDDRPMIVAIHHHVRPFHNSFIDFFGTTNGDDVHLILKKALPRLRGVFSGHIHQAIDTYDEGILYSFVQSPQSQGNLFPVVENQRAHSVVPSPGFSVVTVTAERTYVRRFIFEIKE